jgi:hypothetical protein
MAKRILMLAFALSAAPLLAATLAGVTMPDTITVGDRTLVLNGTGVRSKPVKVWEGCTEHKSGDAKAIIQADPSRVCSTSSTARSTAEDGRVLHRGLRREPAWQGQEPAADRPVPGRSRR